MVKKFGTRESFLVTYNPDFQRKICATAEVCYFGDYPTLSELKVYGERMATAWLIPQLYNLSEYCGCKEKLQGKSLEECAFIIATEFYYLKISEIMLFFHRCKTGAYGRFYGSVDPFIILTSLRQFTKERVFAYEKHESELRQRQREENRKNAVPYEEYLKMKKSNKL